jgi:DNA adenine methylase
LAKPEKIYRSPLFYVGDKYKLIKEIKAFFPHTIKRFIEPFVGGGSVYLNIDADEYLLNDLDNNVIALHQFLCSYIGNETEFFKRIFSLIKKYQLSFSFDKNVIPLELKQQYKKTYYARYNKEHYSRLKTHYNWSKNRDIAELYVLLIYGFNRMLRFNGNNDFNVPVGNVDFNTNVYNALVNYFRLNAVKKTNWFNLDFRDFVQSLPFRKGDFVYLDPPYLITFSEYNKWWNMQSETDLLQILDGLHKMKIPFAVSNATHYKGQINTLFIEWSKKYNSHCVKSNYISFHDNSVKNITEVLITNF